MQKFLRRVLREAAFALTFIPGTIGSICMGARSVGSVYEL